MTSSDEPQPPGSPLRDDEPAGPLQPTDGEHGAVPDTDEESEGPAGSVPPIHTEPTQSESEAALQQENAGTSLDQPST